MLVDGVSGGSTSSTTSPPHGVLIRLMQDNELERPSRALHALPAAAAPLLHGWHRRRRQARPTTAYEWHSRRAHRPVQYAAPREKKTEMSLPISPDHSSSSSADAGRPHSSLAAHSVVAALPEPPPRPAPCGTRLRRSTRNRWLRPVLRRNRLSACGAREGGRERGRGVGRRGHKMWVQPQQPHYMQHRLQAASTAGSIDCRQHRLQAASTAGSIDCRQHRLQQQPAAHSHLDDQVALVGRHAVHVAGEHIRGGGARQLLKRHVVACMVAVVCQEGRSRQRARQPTQQKCAARGAVRHMGQRPAGRPACPRQAWRRRAHTRIRHSIQLAGASAAGRHSSRTQVDDVEQGGQVVVAVLAPPHDAQEHVDLRAGG